MAEETFELRLKTIGDTSGITPVIDAEEKRMVATDKGNQALERRRPILQHLIQDEQQLTAATEQAAQKQEKLSADAVRALEEYRAKMAEVRKALPPMDDKAFASLIAEQEGIIKATFAKHEAAQQQVVDSIPEWARTRRSGSGADEGFLAALHKTGNEFAAQRDREPENGGGGIRGQLSGFMGARKDTRSVDRVLGLVGNPEMAGQMGVESVLSGLGASLPTIIAGVGALTVAFKALQMGMQALKQEDPHLEAAFGNLHKAVGGFLADAIKPFVGETQGMTAAINTIIRMLGGETEAMKASHGPIKDHINFAAEAKTATQKWAEEEKKLESAMRSATQAIRDQSDEDAKFQASLSNDRIRELEEERAQINKSEVLSAQEKAEKLIEIDEGIAAEKQAMAAAEKDRLLQQQEDELDLLDKKGDGLEEAAKAQHERNQKIDAYTDVQRELTAKTTALDVMGQEKGAKDEFFMKLSPALALVVKGVLGEYGGKDNAEGQLKAEIEALKAKADVLGKQVPGGVEKLNPEEEQKAEAEKKKKAAEARQEEADKLAHVQSLRAQRETERVDEKKAAEDRKSANQKKLDELRGEGEFAGQPSLDEKNAANNAGKPTSAKPAVEGSTAPTTTPSSSPSSPPVNLPNVSTMHVAHLQVDHATGLGGGSGGNGTGSGRSGNGHSADGTGHAGMVNHGSTAGDSHALRHPPSDVRGKLLGYAHDRLASDIHEAEQHADKGEEAKALQKAWFDNQFRLQHLDEAVEQHTHYGHASMQVGGAQGVQVDAKSHAPHAHSGIGGGNWSGDIFSTAPGQGGSDGRKVGLSGQFYGHENEFRKGSSEGQKGQPLSVAQQHVQTQELSRFTAAATATHERMEQMMKAQTDVLSQFKELLQSNKEEQKQTSRGQKVMGNRLLHLLKESSGQ